MRFIIEFDGVVFDPHPIQYQAHQQAAGDVGWSRLDSDRFRRLTRTKGRQADLLPGAKQVKCKEYEQRFNERLESDTLLKDYALNAGVSKAWHALQRFGSCQIVTLGTNLSARQRVLLASELGDVAGEIVAVEQNAVMRPQWLSKLAGGDSRTLIVACDDSLVRSGNLAEMISVGIDSGMCNARRLHQASAGVVYKELGELVESLGHGARDLIQAGLLPDYSV